jgi:UDP-3-O-acyl-N-acetylglucosamine deacetylase
LILPKILFVELQVSCEVEVVEMVDACQALEKGMGGFVATVEHVMKNVEKQRTCAKEVEERQYRKS